MRLLRKSISGYLCVLAGLALAVILTGCYTLGIFGSDNPGPLIKSSHGTGTMAVDPLHIGDRIAVELAGIPDPIPSSPQDIKEDGSINLPYIGRVMADGKSPSTLEKEITAAYVPAYYTRIGITVTPVARYFFVMGQVVNPGRIIYAGPITVLSAIGAAGDFTPFANKRKVQVIRPDGSVVTINCFKAINKPKLDIFIHPGDKIQVGRRF